MSRPTQAIHYRVAQFFRALTARVSDEEVEQATRFLAPEARALFRRQVVQDQRHALTVYRALQQAGHTEPRLLAAALLHDIGKAAGRLPPPFRATIVLLERFAPGLLARLSRGEPGSWNGPFVVHARHPETGAHWAQEAGCSPLTVALIRRHEEKPTRDHTEEDQFLAVLQAADSTN
jgi:hypothetical protein